MPVWLWWHAATAPERRIHRQAAIPPPASPTAPPPAIVVTRKPSAGASDSALAQSPPGTQPRPVQNVLEAQIALDREGLSPGSLDGRMGPQTRAAIRALQRKEHVPETGELDAETAPRLLLAGPPLGTYTVSSNDLARLQPLSRTWAGKAQQTVLDYETVLELVAEKSHSNPGLIRQLNPEVDWTKITVGAVLRVPDVTGAIAPAKAAFLRISLMDKTLDAFDAGNNLLAHFPCSIARQVEKRPVGQLHVLVIAPDPNYTFDPDMFPDSPEARQLRTKLVLPPGPNNPVGTVWIGLDKPGYGIHGTPHPEQVGRTESHGCFRLANWNAEYLLKMIWVGMPVYVDP